jgi:hypothetical protein
MNSPSEQVKSSSFTGDLTLSAGNKVTSGRFTLRDGSVWDNLKNDEVWYILNNTDNEDWREYFMTQSLRYYETLYESGFDNPYDETLDESEFITYDETLDSESESTYESESTMSIMNSSKLIPQEESLANSPKSIQQEESLANSPKSIQQEETENDKPKQYNKLKLRIATIKTDDDEYYYIWELATDEILNDDHMSIFNHHPFARIEIDEILSNEDKTLSIRHISAKNSVTDSFFKMIMMTEEEMNENCGAITSYCYRQRLITILHADLSD